MFDIKDIWSSENKMKISTGLDINECNIIFENFEQELIKIRHQKKQKSSVGRPAKLTTKEIFLMLMIFIRHYPTYDLLSVIFDIDTSNVKRWIDDSHMVLGDILVKKNFAHLILLNQERLSKSALGKSEKFILMELNNLLDGQKIKNANNKIIQEKRNDTLQKSS